MKRAPGHGFKTLICSLAAGHSAALLVTILVVVGIRRAGFAWSGATFGHGAFNWKDAGVLLLACAAFNAAMIFTAGRMRRGRRRKA